MVTIDAASRSASPLRYLAAADYSLLIRARREEQGLRLLLPSLRSSLQHSAQPSLFSTFQADWIEIYR